MDENTKATEQAQEVPETGQQPNATPEGEKPAAAPATDQNKTAPGKAYTEAELETLKATWRQEYEQSQTAEKDFAKMTPEQKAQKLLDDQKAETTRLQAKLADRDLTDYARGKMAAAEMPADALAFIKGKDEADTDAKIRVFGAMLAAGIQSGVEKRFKTNGYTPRGTAAGSSGGEVEKRARGVTVSPGR